MNQKKKTQRPESVRRYLENKPNLTTEVTEFGVILYADEEQPATNDQPAAEKSANGEQRAIDK